MPEFAQHESKRKQFLQSEEFKQAKAQILSDIDSYLTSKTPVADMVAIHNKIFRTYYNTTYPFTNDELILEHLKFAIDDELQIQIQKFNLHL